MRLRSLLVLAAALLPLAGCSERAEAPLAPESPSAVISSDIDLAGILEFATLPDLTGARSVAKLVRASEGGFLELNGFRLDIPAGALAQDTVVTLELPRDELKAKHVLVDLSPRGLRFNREVKLTLPLEGVLWAGEPVEVARWAEDQWVSVGGAVSEDATSLSSSIPELSTYGAQGGSYLMGGG